MNHKRLTYLFLISYSLQAQAETDFLSSAAYCLAAGIAARISYQAYQTKGNIEQTVERIQDDVQQLQEAGGKIFQTTKEQFRKIIRKNGIYSARDIIKLLQSQQFEELRKRLLETDNNSMHDALINSLLEDDIDPKEYEKLKQQCHALREELDRKKQTDMQKIKDGKKEEQDDADHEASSDTSWGNDRHD